MFTESALKQFKCGQSLTVFHIYIYIYIYIYIKVGVSCSETFTYIILFLQISFLYFWAWNYFWKSRVSHRCLEHGGTVPPHWGRLFKIWWGVLSQYMGARGGLECCRKIPVNTLKSSHSVKWQESSQLRSSCQNWGSRSANCSQVFNLFLLPYNTKLGVLSKPWMINIGTRTDIYARKTAKQV